MVSKSVATRNSRTTDLSSLLLKLVALMLTFIPCSAQAQGVRPRVDPATEIPPSAELPAGAIETDAIFDGYPVTYRPDVVYAEYGERQLVLNLLLPVGRSGQANPLVVFIQGSAWLPQDVYRSLPQLVDVARAGYVIASVEYRHSLEATAPAQAQDVKAAIRFLRAQAGEYSIDPERVAVWGTSSGGHLAALVGVSEGEPAFLTDANAAQSSAVQAVVDFFGPTDFRRMDDYPSRIAHDAPDSPESRVVGGPIQSAAVSETVKQYNPITFIDGNRRLPPFLIVHGDVDPLVPFNQSVLLYEALQEAGQTATLVKVLGGGHGDGIFSAVMMERVVEFLDQSLR